MSQAQAGRESGSSSNLDQERWTCVVALRPTDSRSRKRERQGSKRCGQAHGEEQTMASRITTNFNTRVVKRTARDESYVVRDDIPAGIDEVISAFSDPGDMQSLSGRYVDVALPFDGGNVWKSHGVFTQVPAWMRSFLYRILKPREIALYIYICSYMRLAGISYVSLREMQRDFGLTNRHELIESISNLERLGFLLRKKGRVAKARTEHDRNIYQRPSIAHTLWTLLDEDAIDGLFHPTVRACLRANTGKAPIPTGKYIDRSLLGALAELISKSSLKFYLSKSTSTKASCLKALLRAKLDELQTLASLEKSTSDTTGSDRAASSSTE